MLVEAGKVEEDIGFHGSEEGEAGDLSGLVEKLGAGDLAIATLVAGATQDKLDKIHLVDNILESTNVGVRNLGANRDVAQGVEVLHDVVGQLMLGCLADDALELLRVDEAIAVLIEELEGLSDTLALEATQHLGELMVIKAVAVLLAANVQLRPLRLPVKGNGLGALVELIQSAEVVVLDAAGALNVEETESNLILGIRLVEEMLKDTPVGEVHPASILDVGNTEKDGVLLTGDFMLVGEGGSVEFNTQPIAREASGEAISLLRG